MLPNDSVLSQSFKQASWDVVLSLDTNLNPDFNSQNPFFFIVAVGFTFGRRVALLNLPPLEAAILVKLVQSQQRVKGIGFGYDRNPPQLLCALKLMFNVSFKTLIELRVQHVWMERHGVKIT